MGVKKNFGYNLVLTFCNYLFPLITYPYISRVLGVELIGACSFVDSIINYFILFSMLGVGSYGVREISRCGDDHQRRTTVFSSLVSINALLSTVAIAALVVCTFTIPQLNSYKEFLGIGLVKLIFNIFLIEWFFQGIEQFKYITIRSVIIRALYVLAILLFVNNKEDVYIYYGLTTAIVVLNSIINWNYSRKFIRFSIRSINLKLILVPVLTFGYYRLLTSMYTTFNTTFLGFSSGDVEVGYFSTATKLYSIIMGVFSAFTTVMVPRVSSMLAKKDMDGIQRVADQTFEILFLLGVPMIIFCQFFAPQIIYLIAGAGYEGAVLPFRIVILLLIIIGMEQIVIQQFLMASDSNKSIVCVSTVGAVTGILLNVLLTPHIGAVGSAVSWCISEVAVLIVGVILMRRHVRVAICWKRLVMILLGGIAYILLMYAIILFMSSWAAMAVSALCVFGLFLLLSVKVYKNRLVSDMLSKLIRR